MIICIDDVLSLNGAEFQYKISKYPKGFWNSETGPYLIWEKIEEERNNGYVYRTHCL